MSALPTPQLFDPNDPVFVVHEGGKLAVHATSELRDAADLSLLYTPGVADVSRAIAVDPTLADVYTSRRNTVAVVSDGTAVLGLGAVGPLAAMPVMEGKAVLFKHFADVDAVPVCMETGTVEEIVEAVARIAPTYGGINLEDISAPRCFEIERRLKERLDIPVFHDDQHGTAIVALAALLGAVEVVEKTVGELTVVVAGAGAAGVAVTRILLAAGVGEVIVTDSRGVLGPDRAEEEGLPVHKADLMRDTNRRGVTGTIGDALEGADVLIGVSGGTVVERDLMRMAPRAIIFALANPDPEVHPTVARRFAEVVATGRSDFPNQINNVLAFPGIFRGALDSGARAITEEMKLAAAHAIAGLVEHPTAERIVPSVFDERVAPAVADAVARLASRR
jgi:malate dehydrogenase (oxaloacetate-decarboxylating)